ncbi:MAG: Alcohol dehydrogenase, zinc-binding domain protein [Bryobacterales bacterium]|nr:Alcohol dehydrogenase, zinc-binding domain protein [Bryobacterales bacterium]
MKAVYIEQTGGVDVMRYGDFPTPQPGPGEVLVKVAYSGVNFVDTYFRSGLYKAPLPAVLGSEASGKVEKLGEGVTQFKPGDRVAYAMARGSYAEFHAIPAGQLVKIPDNVDDATAAAAMLQGCTAHYLTHSTFLLKGGQTTLVHAAAGGTGRLIVQMATMIGARVIAAVGSEAKAKITLGDGASAAILYDQQDFVAETKRLTDGKGVEVIYDGVGQATFLKGLDCLKPRGMMVAFGQSSGPVAPFDVLLLSQKGSLYVTRPTLATYIASREDLEWRTSDLFRWIGEGKLKIHIDKIYPLAEAAQAHRDLEGRKTTGKLLLKIP